MIDRRTYLSNEGANGPTKRRTDRREAGPTHGRTDEKTDRRTLRRTDRRTLGRTDEKTGFLDGRLNSLPFFMGPRIQGCVDFHGLTKQYETGEHTLNGVIQYFRQLSAVNSSYSAQLKDTISKCNTISKDDSNVWPILEETNNFFLSLSKLADKMSEAINSKILASLDQTRAQYSQAAQVCGCSSGGLVLAGMDKDDASYKRKLARAQAKVALADEEHGTAQQSKNELVYRFGDSLKTELLEKASERVKRASLLKQQAMSELNKLTGQSGSNSGAKQMTPEPLTPDKAQILEKLELQRINSTRDSVVSLVRLQFKQLQSMGGPVVRLGQFLETFSPNLQLEAWICKLLNGAMQAESKVDINDRINVLSTEEKAWLSGESASNVDSVFKGIVKSKDLDILRLEQENSSLREEIQFFRKGGPAVAKDVTKSSAEPPLNESRPSDISRRSTIIRRQSLETSRPPQQISSTPIGAISSLDSLSLISEQQVSIGDPRVEKTSLLKRLVTSIKGTKSSDSKGEFFVLSETSSEEAAALEESSPDVVVRSASSPSVTNGSYESFRLSDYVPRLTERLKINFVEDTRISDKFLEVQRRYEEYMWSFRNLHIADLIRTEQWDSADYFQGFYNEYGMSAYTIKLPFNSPLARFAEDPQNALEWGSVSISWKDWKLFSYETLLIVYHSISQALVAREVARLPAQDIQGILNEQQFEAPTTNHGTKHHRRFSVGAAFPGLMNLDNAADGVPQFPEKQDRSGVTEDPTQTKVSMILMNNASIIKTLLRIWRVKLKLSSNDASIITGLLLPHGLEFGEESHSLGFSPLDVRYRVSRLHSSWIAAAADQDNSLKKTMKSNIAKKWVLRQLHFVRISILLKVQRIVKFLPQHRGMYNWLLKWRLEQDWEKFVASNMPTADSENDNFLNQNLSQLLDCLKLSMMIVADLLGAVQADKWGQDEYRTNDDPIRLESFGDVVVLRSVDLSKSDEIPKSDENYYGYRNAEGLLRLIALMGCMSGLDKCIRLDIAEDEKDALTSAGLRAVSSLSSTMEKNDFLDEDDDNPQDAAKVLFGEIPQFEAANFDLLAVLEANGVDPYWQYELPIQHLIISELCTLVCERRSASKLGVDAAIYTQLIIIIAHIIQHGYDPSVWGALKVSQSLITMDTIALYLTKAVWEECTATSRKLKDYDVEESGSETSDSENEVIPKRLLLTGEVISSMNLFASNLGSWLVQTSRSDKAMSGEAGTSVMSVSIEPPASVNRGQTEVESLIQQTRVTRILSSTPQDLFESLNKPKGEFRGSKWKAPELSEVAMINSSGVAGGNEKYTHCSDPDFSLLDLEKLDELADKPTIFQQIENIREEPEGISFLLPSRLERIMNELCLRRLITNEFRLQLLGTLSNYRNHYEADTLSSVIYLYERINDLLVLSPMKVPPPVVMNNNTIGGLSVLLRGPIAQYDMYRYWISSTVRNMFQMVFGSALEKLKSPPEEENWFLSRLIDIEEESDRLDIERAWSAVIGRFSEGCSKFINELRGELIHYSSIWYQFLPGNQHALIVMYIADDLIRNTLLENLRNSPYWPEEDLPPNSAGIISFLATFEQLVHDVRLSTRCDQLLVEVDSLTVQLSSSIITALNKKLKSIDSILERCMKSDTWKPISTPDIMYSPAVVDYFQFINHILDSVYEFNANIDWICPILIQFLSQLSRQYSDFLKSTVNEPKLTSISNRSNMIFHNLTSPLPRIDVSMLHNILPYKKKKFINKIFKTSKTRDITTQIQQLQKIQPMSGADEETTVVEDDEDFVESDNDTKSKKKKNKINVTHELKELASRIGPELAVQLLNAQNALSSLPLPTYLTKLHNLIYFTEQLPTLSSSIVSSLTRNLQSANIPVMKALEKAGGRKVNVEGPGFGATSPPQVSGNAPSLNNAVEQCITLVNLRAREICKASALRIIYIDFCCDIFEDLYNPSFTEGPNLQHIVASLSQTVLKFTQAAPSSYRHQLLQFIVHDLTKAWALLITELGYMGTVFTSEDITVLENDLQSLKTFAQNNRVDAETSTTATATAQHGLLAKIRGSNADDPNSVATSQNTINIFEQVAEFLQFLNLQPLLLAQLGGNYNPDKMSRKTEQPQPGPEAEKQGANVFAELGGGTQPAAAGFDAKDILGTKPKKGVFAGMLKAVKFK